jgi:hypothetical protein
MKLHYYWTLLLVLQTSFISAQIGIGTQYPDASSILDVESTKKGLLFPRLTTSERNLIENPAHSLLIYNSTNLSVEMNIGTKTNPNWVSLGSSSISTSLATSAIFVGNSQGMANPVFMSGDASLSSLGVITIENQAVISKTLTGYTTNTGKISATDNIVQAIQKLDGNKSINAIKTINNDYVLLLDDYTIVCDAEFKSITIILPEVSNAKGKVYSIAKIDETDNVLYINPPIQLTKTNTISALNYPKYFKIQSDGRVWYIIN